MEESQGQAQAASELSIEERVAAALQPEPIEKEPEEKNDEDSENEEHTPASDEGQEEDAEEAKKIDEKTAEESSLEWDKIKDAKLEITVQGEKSEVTLEEARLGYMRTADYQKKTQELSTQRRQVVDEASQVVEQIQDNYSQQLATLQETVQKLAMQELSNVDLNYLAETDPNAYIRYQHRMSQFNQFLQSVTAEQNKVQEQKTRESQAKHTQLREQGMAELQTRIPNFNNDVKATLIKAGTDYGFSNDEMTAIIDPRVLHILNDARQYRELKTAKPETNKKVVEVPRVIKPGAKQSSSKASADQGRDLRERIKKSGGKDEDALTAFIKRTLK